MAPSKTIVGCDSISVTSPGAPTSAPIRHLGIHLPRCTRHIVGWPMGEQGPQKCPTRRRGPTCFLLPQVLSFPTSFTARQGLHVGQWEGTALEIVLLSILPCFSETPTPSPNREPAPATTVNSNMRVQHWMQLVCVEMRSAIHIRKLWFWDVLSKRSTFSGDSFAFYQRPSPTHPPFTQLSLRLRSWARGKNNSVELLHQ